MGTFSAGAMLDRDHLRAQRDEIDRLAAELLNRPPPFDSLWELPHDIEALSRAVTAAWPRSGSWAPPTTEPHVARRLRKLWTDGRLTGRCLSQGNAR